MRANKALPLPFLVLLLASTGCPPGGVPLRPDGTPGPQKCPEEALKTMKLLGMNVGDAAGVELDANQVDMSPITLYDGPVESILMDQLGHLDAGSRLYGHVWTAGTLVVVRYYEARPPRGGDIVPICAVARLGGGQMRKLPGSKPGMALLEFSSAGVYVVDSFR